MIIAQPPALPPPIQTVATAVVTPDQATPRSAPEPELTGGASPDLQHDVRGWTIRVGAGILAVPAFAGAKSYRIVPLPAVDIGYREVVTASVNEGLNLAIVRLGDLRAGPTLRYRFGQYEDDARQGLRGLGDVPGALEGGSTLTWRRRNFGVRGYAGWDLGTGHKGGVAELSAFLSQPVRLSTRRILVLRAGPKVAFATQRYFQSYYGVDAAQSASSGLASYRPGGGLEKIGLDGSATLRIGTRWAVTMIASAADLAAEAAYSPRVRERGSRRQGSLGFFLGYSI